MGSDGRELFRARTSVAEACLWWHPDGESRRASPPVAASLTASSVAHTERERLRDSKTAAHTERERHGPLTLRDSEAHIERESWSL